MAIVARFRPQVRDLEVNFRNFELRKMNEFSVIERLRNKRLFYQGIIVTKVNPDGPAQGTLRPGDKILEVDGIDFTRSDHNTAVAVLRSTGAIVSMLISRHQ